MATCYPAIDRTLVGGTWLTHEGPTLPIYRPADGTVLATVPRQGPAEVDVAARAAQEALGEWSSTDPARRSELLAGLARALRDDRENLAELISEDVGTPLRIARAVQVDLPIRVLETTAEVLAAKRFERSAGNSTIRQVPVGVVGAITPWNYPLHQSVAKVAGALAAGCTLVHKPSEVAPLALLRFAELVFHSDIPAGVYNQVSGLGVEVGSAIVEHPAIDKISFTGSTTVGREVGARAARALKRVSLELGGKSASVVLPGADLEAAVKATVSNAFLNSGQTCTAWTRLLVAEDDYEEAIALAASFTAVLEPRLGPLASQGQYDRVQRFIRNAVRDGARVVAGGEGAPPERPVGYYARATVVADVAPDSEIAQEEVFGPVLTVLRYRGLAEATEIANGTKYGLAGGVWGPYDAAIAFAASLRTGQVDINGAAFNPVAPFGGFKLSGVGRELGESGIDDYLETVSIQLPPAEVARSKEQR